MNSIDSRRARRRHARRGARIRGLLSGTALSAAAIVVAVGAAGGTYALWNESETAEGATVRTGSIELQVETAASYTIEDMNLRGLLPGRSVVHASPLSITNAGDVPLEVSWSNTDIASSSPDLAANVIVGVRLAPASGPCVTTALTAVTLPATLTSLAVGEAKRICIETALSSTAPASVQGATAALTLTLTGAQVRP